MVLSTIMAEIWTQVIDGELRQKDGDSGDSALRDGHLYALLRMLGHFLPSDYETAMRGHEVSTGIYRRTKNPAHWGYNPNCLSRDNMQGLRLGFAVTGDTRRLKESWAAIKARGYRHQNTHKGTDCTGDDCIVEPDLVHPSEWGVQIRGMSQWFFRPFLYLIDLFFLGDLWCRRGVADYDQLMLPVLAYAQKKYPTFISRLAWHLYDKEDALAKIDRYYSVTLGNGIAGFAQLFTLLVEHMDGPHQITEISS